MDGRRECEEIRDNREILYIYIYIELYIYIYIYIYYLSNLLILLLNNVHYTIVYWVKILLYSLCLLVCVVSGSVAMATRNHSKIVAHTRRGHIKTALGIGLRIRHRLISVSPRYILLGICIGIAYRQLVSFAIVKRVLKPEEKVAY